MDAKTAGPESPKTRPKVLSSTGDHAVADTFCPITTIPTTKILAIKPAKTT